MNDRSIAIAKLIMKQLDSAEDGKSSQAISDTVSREMINLAFQNILQREASEQEQQRLVSYGSRMIQYHHQKDAVIKEYPTQITRSLVEEFTGRPFEYEEILPVFENYEQDTKAHQVSEQVRALADICLILFNTNEFIYVE